nr:LysR family transcriptional regulator [Pantoea wallisii]
MVAQTRSLTQAARRLNTTTMTVSRRLAALEEDLAYGCCIAPRALSRSPLRERSSCPMPKRWRRRNRARAISSHRTNRAPPVSCALPPPPALAVAPSFPCCPR